MAILCRLPEKTRVRVTGTSVTAVIVRVGPSNVIVDLERPTKQVAFNDIAGKRVSFTAKDDRRTTWCRNTEVELC